MRCLWLDNKKRQVAVFDLRGTYDISFSSNEVEAPDVQVKSAKANQISASTTSTTLVDGSLRFNVTILDFEGAWHCSASRKRAQFRVAVVPMTTSSTFRHHRRPRPEPSELSAHGPSSISWWTTDPRTPSP